MYTDSGPDGGAPESTTLSEGHVVLPKNVKPTHYNLTVEPDLENSLFYGKVVIDLDIIEDTTSISLNSADLYITETQVNAGLRAVAHNKDLIYNKEQQTLTTVLADTLPAGSKATLTHSFRGSHTDSLSGCYKSLYTGRDGEKKWLATTLFEPTYARKAFPCFDEPALKARFTVSILADQGLTCLSNMDVRQETDVVSPYTNRSKQCVDFNVSPIMSTYLVAYIVGELNVIETNDFRVPIRVFTTPDKDIEHGRFALDLAVKVLKFYEEKFDSAFPLPKMNMVAIPDFMVGAMENWGLVTYRVTALLFDEKTASSAAKIRVAEVVAHELAHQWFGNLVTMDFWEGLWLNEGFATFMSWLCCNAIFPDWKIWEGYITTTYADAMDLDSLRSSHAIELPIKHAEEIEGLFDHISYKKGSGVLRMVCRFLGEDVFLKGVCHYIKAFAYANTKTDDLWASLSHVSGKDVQGLMDIWTRKIGYPVITVTENDAKSTVHVKQNRYLKSGDVKPEEDQTLYPVVLGVRDRQGTVINHVLTTRETELSIPEMSFFKLNADHAGMFRTAYSPERLLKLGQASQAGLLTVEDKAGMIADASALATSGHQRTSAVLSLLQGFKNEDEPVVWEAMRNALAAIRRCWLFEDDKTNKALDKFTLDLAQHKAHSVGWDIKEDDGLTRRQWKKLLVEMTGNAGDDKVRQWASESFRKFTQDGDRNAVHPELRGAMFTLAVKQGGAAEYDAVWREFKTGAKSNTERDLALASLGSTRQPGLISRTLDLMLSEDVRSGEVFMIPSHLKDHKPGKEATLPWLKRNFPALEKRLKDTIIQLDRVVDLTCSGYTTAEHEKEIRDVFEGINTKPFEMKLRQNLDKCRSNAGWLKRDREDVETWLKENGFMA